MSSGDMPADLPRQLLEAIIMGMGCSSSGAVTTVSDVDTAESRSSNNHVSKKSEHVASLLSSSEISVPSNAEQKDVDSNHHSQGNTVQQNNADTQEAMNIMAEATPVTPKSRPMAVDPKLPSLVDLSRDLTKMMCGRMDAVVSREEKMIYIFHCANFTDSVVERSVLQHLAYPELREYCINKGCDLVVYDIQLGIKDEFAFGHILRELSRNIMKQIGTPERRALLTIFLNEKYGVYWCPLVVDQETFDEILKKLTEEDKHFLLEWYTLDNLRMPPSYVLNPVETLIQKYPSATEDIYMEGYREWEKHLIRIRHILFQGSSAEFQKNICKSAIHESLEEFVFSGKWPKDLITWLHRTFYSDMEFDATDTSFANFLDIAVDRINEVAQVRLKSLSERISDKINPDDKLDSQVKWTGNGISPDHKEHGDYLLKLGTSYKEMLLKKIKEEIPKKQEHNVRCKKAIHRGLTKNLYSEVHQHTFMCQRLTKLFCGKETLLNTIEKYIITGQADISATTEGDIKPLVLHGVSGSGKSAVIAQMGKLYCSTEGWTKGVAVLRFVGATTGCETLEQLLLSIREHLCVLAGLPLMIAHQTKDWNLQAILQKMSHETPVILLLDGLDQLLDDCPNTSWIPLNLTKQVRIVISVTTDSEWMKNLQNLELPAMNFIDIPAMKSDEVVDLVRAKFSQNNRIMPETIESLLREQLASATPFHITILLTLLLEKSMALDKQCELISQTTTELINTVFKYLEDRFWVKCIEHIASYIACSRHGLTDSEILDLLSKAQNVGSNIQPYKESLIVGVPCFVWLYVKDILEPLLLERSSHGLLVYQWKSSAVLNVIKTRYHSIFNECEKLILAYYEGTTNIQKKSKTSSITSKPAKTVSSWHSRSQSIEYIDGFNGRKLDELPWLMLRQNQAKELGKKILSFSWLRAKLCASGVLVTCNDLDMCIKQLSDGTQKSSAMFIKDLLHKLAFTLTEDPTQLAVQLHLRSNNKNINIPKGLPELEELFNNCTSHTEPVLQPSCNDLDILGMTYQPEMNVEESHIFSGFFHFKNEPEHIISVAPSKGLLKVWNVNTRKAVRTFTGLQQPKDVKVCDAYKAVVLCNRELKIYDLDSGQSICSLKGVLNIRMPFFGVHDKEHTIAMARNRMYVNMMSNTTGEMVTTFKVGEDRFMDSMLTSENGDKCVCGDAVQKPFPLLVWDLHKRKLIYDLRIQGHEFLTKVSAISKDGHYVACACKELEDPDPMFLVVYDLQSGSLFKKWKETYSPTSVAMSQSLVVSGHENGTVCVWDLISGSLKHELTGHSRGPDFLCLSDNGNRCVSWDTTGRDNTIRLWDLENGMCLGTFSPGSKASCCNISSDGNLVVVGIPGVEHIVTLSTPDKQQQFPQDVSVFGDSARSGAEFDVSESDIT